MTTPEGEAFIEVHADAPEPRLEREMRPPLQAAAEAVEKDMDKAGKDWGESATESMGKTMEKEAPGIFARFRKILSREKITKKVDIEVDRDPIKEAIEGAIGDAFDGAANSGFLNKLSQGFADAIGAGFNVSGRSPLIAVLVPAIGAIVALVLAAVQAVSALVTLLAALPVLIGGIAAQIGVFAIAFQGVGTAIQGAFAAKNANELNEAIKNLTPSAQAFVRELLPLRDLFRDIRNVVQENFFKQLQGDITSIAKALGPLIKSGLGDVAAQLGNVLHLLAGFLNSDLFKDFVADVTGSTVEFLKAFGPGLTRFLDGLTRLAIAATPLLDDFGKQLSAFLANMGRVFSDIANSGEFQDFLDDMGTTFFNLFQLVNSLSGALASLGGALNTAGGNDAIKAFSEALDQFAFFLQTPLGTEGLKALIDISIFALKVTVGLIEAIISFLAILRNTPAAIGAFFDFVGGKILDAANAIGRFFSDLWKKITGGGEQFMGFIKTIPDRITALFKNAGSLLLQAGRNIINGLIQGIREKLGPLGDIMSFVGQKISNFVPHSPAKEGPLSGQGDPQIAGQKIVQRLGEGMHMEIPQLRAASDNVVTNILFGAGAIQQSFAGLPNRTQATAIGQSVASGIQDGLTNRDTRLAVRTL
jgi:hypothetical protein